VLVPGQRFERYELLCPVAQGGMAWVWLARLLGKHGFEKLVAIKTILPEFAADMRFQKMFLDEAHIASGIRHANVAQILDLGESRKVLYLVMEWVDGESLIRLGQALDEKEKELPNGVLLRVMADACGGLHAAHELADKQGHSLGVVHRDVSPDNILVDARGSAKIIDFGVAKARDRLGGGSSSGMVKGKLEYMAPEQALGRAIDRRADVWGVGAVLYSLIARRFAYEGENHVEIAQRMAAGTAPAPLPGWVPSPIASVIMKSIAVDPDQRFATALDQQNAIEQAMIAANCATSTAEVAQFFADALPERAAERRESVEMALAAASRRSIPSPLLDDDRPHVALRSAETLPEIEARPAIPPGPRESIPHGVGGIELDDSSHRAPIDVSGRPPQGTNLSTPGPMRVSSHSFSTGRHRSLRAVVTEGGSEVVPERKRLWAAVAAIAIVLAGGSLLELTQHGAFLRHDVADRIHAGHHADLERTARKRAREARAQDTLAASNAALVAIEAMVHEAPRYRPLLAYATYVHYAHEIRFGNDPSIDARASALSAHLDDKTPGWALASGARDLHDGKLASARFNLEAALHEDDKSVEALLLLGELELRTKQPKEALAYFELAQKLADDASTASGRMRAIALDGDIARARSLARPIADKYAGHVASRVVLARFAWRKDHDEAEASRWLDEIDRPEIVAGASSAEKIETKTLRGAIHLARGRIAEARAAFESAIAISSVDADIVDAEVGLGDCHMANGDHARAVAHYEAALEVAPDSAPAKAGIERARAKLQTP